MFDNTLINRLVDEKDFLKRESLLNQFERECQEMDQIRDADMMGENGEVS